MCRLTALRARCVDLSCVQSKVRARLANPPPSLLPTDPAKASLYLAWKRALAEREELLRQARKRKHELIRDLKTRHETQVVLLEMERRAAVDNLNKSVEAEREKVEAYKKELVSLDESIESARNAMSRFRQEFEQLRVALLIDKMAKSSQVCTCIPPRLLFHLCLDACTVFADMNHSSCNGHALYHVLPPVTCVHAIPRVVLLTSYPVLCSHVVCR